MSRCVLYVDFSPSNENRPVIIYKKSRFAEIGAPLVAYEPPELIGGNISVSTAKPDIIEKASVLCEKNGVKLIVGAGIKTHNDILTSLKLGAAGGLVASGVVLASNPAVAITSLINN